MPTRISQAPRSARHLVRPAAIACAAVLLLAGFADARPFDPPLPKPRPDHAPAASSAAPAAMTEAAAARPKGKVQINPSSRFTPREQEALYYINAYFNSFQAMEGKFIQFGPHGEQSEGLFYMARPGKIRFHYSPPVKLDVIADGKNVAVLDTRSMTQDYYPLSKTPLRYLLARSINLTSDKLINEVREDPDLIAVTIVENSTFVKGKLTLIFDIHNYALKQWIVTDAQGLNTSVAIYDVVVGKRSDPALFKINYYANQ